MGIKHYNTNNTIHIDTKYSLIIRSIRRKYIPIKFKLGEFNIYYFFTINF